MKYNYTKIQKAIKDIEDWNKKKIEEAIFKAKLKELNIKDLFEDE